MDDVDIASEQEEAARREALRVACTRPTLKPRGSCYNCGEGCWNLFCDADCILDYDKRTRLHGRMHPQRAFAIEPEAEVFDQSPIREPSSPERGELDAQTPRSRSNFQ